MITLTPRQRAFAIAFFAVAVSLPSPVWAQEKSVNPGINAPYEKNPNAKKFVASFETESREVYVQRKEIVAACRLKPGMSVADVGAGTGLFTRLFAAEVTPSGTVYAADIAENFLQHIKASCEKAGIKNVKTVLCKVDSSELPPNSVDVVFLCDVYHHFEFPVKTLASLNAALKPGGRLVLVDYRRIQGKTTAYIMKHVRAGQEVVTREIEAAGFQVKREEKFLKENYLLEFQRVEAKAKPAEPPRSSPKLSYSRDIRPILAESCFACHGADAAQRKADLRLDVRAIAVKEAIVPGKAAESPLWNRITSDDPDEQMPPPESRKPHLTPAAAAKLRRWIDEGAEYESHWAYTAPKRPTVPQMPEHYTATWVRNPIDHFIAAGHAEHGLEPSVDADPRRLLRRMRFDLTGLPPTPEEAAAFTADSSPAAYERNVDRLLALPQFGERMAMYWLDVVRYADTGGYHSDNERDVWLYRDYVIQAFNDNKPFDQFTLEQLAGDLLPGADREQKIASGYNRLLQTTEEGGAQAKEYSAKYAADRVRNTAAAWLGSTMGCCQCHDHKYDPFTTKDFYSFGAFFADVREEPIKRQEQTPVPTPEQEARLKTLKAELAAAEAELAALKPDLAASQETWEKSVKAAPPSPKNSSPKNKETPPLPKNVAAALKVDPAKRSKKQKQLVAEQYRSVLALHQPAAKKVEDLKRERARLQAEIPTTLITQAVPPRTMRILPRGNWQDDSAPIVTPAIPEFLGKIAVKDRRPTRLDLAQWMVSRDNPLVARVLVNRLWKLLFGQGLVRTCDDLGTQGTWPTHPELLDWLAVELIDSGWNVKHVMKLMVMSRTYQQSSNGSPERDSRDPANSWLARQGRFRLDAEMVRDNALAVSGLLSPRIGGPSVKPYQPAGYWDYLNFPQRQWQNDHGENQYRRGLYTFWQRTFLHPSLLAFDASTREECTVDRPRSNTPLQALALLNDPTYVEASKVFAARIVLEGGRTESERLRYAYRRALERDPTSEEAGLLLQLYRRHLAQYQADPAAAAMLLNVGDAKPPKEAQPAELAAWTSVARVVLNLHETVTRD
jgi:ubiquinone/menaquinone biosynthesis C-methylase UbiE